MQYVIPQFIDVEDKIIGPIAVRQFIILIITALGCFIFYKLFDFWLFILMAILTVVIGGALAFLKVNGRPFHYFILNLFATFKKPKLRVWQKMVSSEDLKQAKGKKIMIAPIPTKKPLVRSRLAELALIVDTGGLYEAKGDELTLNNHSKT